MPQRNFSADSPISDPGLDLFGLAPFAKAVAESIAAMPAPDGVVIGINGPWGSGKSSATNLVRHYLSEAASNGSLKVSEFNPWWYASSEAMAQGFFKELDRLIEKTLGKKISKTLKGLALHVEGGLPTATELLKFGLPFFGGVGGTALAAAPAATAAAKKLKEGLIVAKSLSTLHREISEALRSQDKRILIIIDDIDRLSPNDAIEVFKLVKSVGRLPNVIYLLAFDRIVAEKLVKEKFPSEGPQYLEKIVQATFELPEPDKNDLISLFVTKLNNVVAGDLDDRAEHAFATAFINIVGPLIRSPRDVLRLINIISVTWPPIRDGVDLGNFVALEAIRLFQPGLYSAIRRNEDALCGSFEGDSSTRPSKEHYEMLLLSEIDDQSKEWAITAIKLLFPKTQAIWGRTTVHGYGTWRRQRLVCAHEHFDSYFRFKLSDQALPKAEVAELVRNAGDREYMKSYLLRAAETKRGGGTKAGVALSVLLDHCESVAVTDIPNLVSVLMETGADLDTAADKALMMGFFGNTPKIELLIENVLSLLSQTERLAVVESAIPTSALSFLLNFVAGLLRGETSRPDLLDNEDLQKIRERTLERTSAAASDGSLANEKAIVSLMFRWADIADNYDQPKEWLASKLADDEFVLRFARNGFSEGRAQGFGSEGIQDAMRRFFTCDTKSLLKIVDLDALLRRVDELIASATIPSDDKKDLATFKRAAESDMEDRRMKAARQIPT